MIRFIIYLICSTGGMVLFKLGASNTAFVLNRGVIDFKLSLLSFAGMVLYLVSFVLWMTIIQDNNLSYISPLATGISYILIVLSSLFILKESISGFQWMGIVIILVGVVLMNIKK
ncbi:MAG: hypothetical protein ACM3S4_10370 [Burkholderiales bacterium]